MPENTTKPERHCFYCGAPVQYEDQSKDNTEQYKIECMCTGYYTIVVTNEDKI